MCLSSCSPPAARQLPSLPPFVCHFLLATAGSSYFPSLPNSAPSAFAPRVLTVGVVGGDSDELIPRGAADWLLGLGGASRCSSSACFCPQVSTLYLLPPADLDPPRWHCTALHCTGPVWLQSLFTGVTENLEVFNEVDGDPAAVGPLSSCGQESEQTLSVPLMWDIFSHLGGLYQCGARGHGESEILVRCFQQKRELRRRLASCCPAKS